MAKHSVQLSTRKAADFLGSGRFHINLSFHDFLQFLYLVRRDFSLKGQQLEAANTKQCKINYVS